MTARVTQQIVKIVYSATPEARVTGAALEVIRSVSASALTGGIKQPTVFIISS